MNTYRKIFREADANVSKIIKDLIETDWSGSVEEKMKAVSLLKGLATSEDKMAVKFMKDLDAATSKMKPATYNESFRRRLVESESIVADTYANNKEEIEDAIVSTADSFVGNEDSENAISAMYDEGIFDPFIEAGADEDEIYENEDEQFEASKIWINVLFKTNKKKYAKIIAEFKRIEKEGL